MTYRPVFFASLQEPLLPGDLEEVQPAEILLQQNQKNIPEQKGKVPLAPGPSCHWLYHVSLFLWTKKEFFLKRLGRIYEKEEPRTCCLYEILPPDHCSATTEEDGAVLLENADRLHLVEAHTSSLLARPRDMPFDEQRQHQGSRDDKELVFLDLWLSEMCGPWNRHLLAVRQPLEVPLVHLAVLRQLFLLRSRLEQKQVHSSL